MYQVFICILIIVIIAVFYINRKPSENKIQGIYDKNHELIEEYNNILKQIDYEENRIIEIKSCREEYYYEFESLMNRTKIAINNFLKWNDILSDHLMNQRYENYLRNESQLQNIISELKIIRDSLESLKQRIYNDIDFIEKQENKRKKEEQKWKEYQEIIVKDSSSVYFTGCNNMDDLNKRYRALMKVYHPDNQTGDSSTFQQVRKEYEKMKGILEKNER